MKCAVCGKETEKKFVNPYNSKDRAYYCDKHLKSISKCFGNFLELFVLTKDVVKR